MLREAQPAVKPAPAMHVGLCGWPAGQQSICVFVKRTYDLAPGRRMTRSGRGEATLNLTPVEEDGDGREPIACLIGECDLIPRKLCTDIVVHGHLRSPGRTPVARMTAALRVGDQGKQVSVFGDRLVSWRPGSRPSFATPQPFVELPLTWRRAFGGIDPTLSHEEPTNLAELLATLDPELHPGAYPRNPAGTGWVIRANERVINGLRLPNFECPAHPLTPERLVHSSADNWVWAPEPAGFGWVSQTWFPRSTLLGAEPAYASLPTHLRAGWLDSSPQLADGPDLRFFSGAPTGQRRFDLRGDELVELHGFHHDGPLSTALPGDRPELSVSFRRRPLEVATRLHTVELFADQDIATMLWVGEAWAPQTLPLGLPLAAEIDSYDLFEGVDVLLDGVPVSRDLMG